MCVCVFRKTKNKFSPSLINKKNCIVRKYINVIPLIPFFDFVVFNFFPCVPTKRSQQKQKSGFYRQKKKKKVSSTIKKIVLYFFSNIIKLNCFQ